ncbi:hypothetical protein ACFO1B_14220 [Dactylosporangium siamense]|uniref:Flagellar hook-length control protein FliK n=1 Tax=Dactylosporangium siamense TaxID=685454 RepID=A0A919PHK0_9ACTN|nr:hypothetical protein [Dactylosporangium siamense]GIG44985.1 hypothetical protein Dsi01nite_030260 [Dactylosporangium siamense]
MTALRRWLALAGTAIAATAVLVFAGPAPAHAAACTPAASGVTVVVDLTPFGGSVLKNCYAGDPPTGLAALTGAGYTVTGTQRWGLAFICRINGKPTAATEPCVNTPPATAYWSYWHGTPGGTWTYSSLGASSYNPAIGTVEGWAFGSGSPPTVAP